MLMILFNFMVIILISFLLLIFTKIISFKMIYDKQKISSFECGFDPKSSARLPFSLQFFLIAVIFLIFDVEITLLLPIPISLNHNNSMMIFLISLFFISILLGGLYYEWNKGALNWMT